MSISYQGIGEWCATLSCGADVSEGMVVKAAAGGTAAKCSAQDGFIGVVRAVGRDGKACSVQLGGLARVSYSGDTAPGVGYGKLSADDAGGVSVDAAKGREYLVLAVDSAAKTAVIKL